MKAVRKEKNACSSNSDNSYKFDISNMIKKLWPTKGTKESKFAHHYNHKEKEIAKKRFQKFQI